MPSEDPGAPAWMMTFGDCMSLLLTFFVMLISFTNFDEAELVEFMSTIKGGFEVAPDTSTLQEIETVFVQPDGRRDPVLLPVDELAHISPLSESMRKIFRDMIEERYGNKIFLTRTEEGLAIILDSTAVFRSASVDLQPGNRSMFRNIGQLLHDTDNEIRITAVVPEAAELDSVSKTPWNFAARRALVFKNMLQQESGMHSSRFGLGTQVTTGDEAMRPGAVRRGFNEYVQVLVVDKRHTRDLKAEEIVLGDDWL